MDPYVKSLQIDKKMTEKYYRKSINKTEQQLFLEKLLVQYEVLSLYKVVDLGCGAGTMSYHLSKLYPNAIFTLNELNEDGLEIAKTICSGPQFSFHHGDATALTLEGNSYDAVFSLMVLLAFDMDGCEKFLRETVRILKPGGIAILSSLFNIDRDVDIFAQITDHTRESAKFGPGVSYMTLSQKTIAEWIGASVSEFNILPFEPGKDINYEGRGLGTSTRMTADGVRLQISAGMLLNWGFLVIRK